MADVDDALEALAVLADDDRMKVAAAVVLGRRTTDDIAAATGLTKRRVLEALTRLEAGALVTHHDGSWQFDVARLKERHDCPFHHAIGIFKQLSRLYPNDNPTSSNRSRTS